MRETWACVEVGAVFGYVETPSSHLANRFAHVIGTLVKLTA